MNGEVLIMRMNRALFVVAAALFFVAPDPVSAYVGPGTGLAVIGAALAFVASIFLGILGFIWYPLKRLFRALGKKGELPDESSE